MTPEEIESFVKDAGAETARRRAALLVVEADALGPAVLADWPSAMVGDVPLRVFSPEAYGSAPLARETWEVAPDRGRLLEMLRRDARRALELFAASEGADAILGLRFDGEPRPSEKESPPHAEILEFRAYGWLARLDRRAA